MENKLSTWGLTWTTPSEYALKQKHKSQYKTKDMYTWINQDTIRKDEDWKVFTLQEFRSECEDEEVIIKSI